MSGVLENNINTWIDGHREWMKESFQECGHHSMYYSTRDENCVACDAESKYLSLDDALSEAYPEDVDERCAQLLGTTKAYVRENGEARYWGFNGGGAASASQKNCVRALLRQHAGTMEAETFRIVLNQLREGGDIVDRQFVSGIIEVLKAL